MASLAVSTTDLVAQGNGFVHPHVAPRSTNFIAQLDARSGFFDLDYLGNGDWHRGDAIYPLPASPGVSPGVSGGFKSFHDGQQLTMACVYDTTTSLSLPAQTVGSTTYPQGPGWHTVDLNGDPTAPLPVLRFLGHLRPPNQGTGAVPGAALPSNAGGSYVDDAAFELLAPTAPWTAGDRVVFFLGSPGTVRSPVSSGLGTSKDDRLRYPGRFSRDGLYRDDDGSGMATQSDPASVRRGLTLTNFFADVSPAPGIPGPLSRCRAAGIYPIIGRIVHSYPNKQTTFEIQRLLEFQRAVELMLADPAATWRPPGVPQVPVGQLVSVAYGGSNGGELSSWLTLFWPDRFYAAAAAVYPPSLRREIGEHAFWDMTMGMTGFQRSGAAYLLGDALQWNMLAVMKTFADGLPVGERYNLWDLSCLLRINQTPGTLPRTIWFIPSDEDTTTTGTDWAADVAGAWAATGGATVAHAGGVTASLDFSIADNRCHENGPFQHPASQGPLVGQEVIGMEQLMPELAIEHALPAAGTPQSPNPNPPAIANVPESGQARGVTVDDVYDSIMSYSPQATPLAANSHPGQAGFLDFSQEPGWRDELNRPGRRQGAGTWLGRQDTMLIRNGSVYVGSADGLVSRYTVPGGTHEPLVLQAQSPVLGKWISGLTHGAFGGAARVICATYSHLFVLNPQTLAVQYRVPVAFDAFWPRRIALGDVDGSVVGNEIICPTHNGGILVFTDGGSGQPVEALHWPEPGVEDLTELAGTLVLQSHRGVVARARFLTAGNGAIANFPSGTFVRPTDAIAELLSASDQQNGVPLDMEAMVDPSGGPTVVALYRDCGGADKSIRKISAFNGAVLTQAWQVDSLPAAADRLPADGSGDLWDLETTRYTPPVEDEDGTDGEGAVGDHLVLLNRGSLDLFDNNLGFAGRRDLADFFPAAGAVDICVGELVSNGSTNGYAEEVVVATRGGRLVWIPVGLLATGGSPATANPLGNADPEYSSANREALGADYRSNVSTSASWGLVAQGGLIHGFDQQGTHWTMAPGGGDPVTVAQTALPGFVGPVKGAGWVPLATNPASDLFGGGEALFLALQNPAWVGSQYGVLTTKPPYPSDPGRRFLLPNSGVSQISDFVQSFVDGFMIFPQPGCVSWSGSGSDFAAHWWSGGRDLAVQGGSVVYGNVVEGLVRFFSPVAIPTPRYVTRFWASTSPYPFSGGWSDNNRDYRSMDYGLSGADLQSMLMLDGEANALLLGTPGGELTVIDPQLDLTAASSSRETTAPSRLDGVLDLGHGIPSISQVTDSAGVVHILAVVSLDHQGSSDWTQNGPSSMAGALHHLTWTWTGPGTGVLSAPLHTIRLDGAVTQQANSPAIVPVGVHCGDVIGGSDLEVVVTGMFGEVLVFNFSGYQLPTGSNPQALQVIRLAGSAGMHGSIVQVGSDLFVAGSAGLWKLRRLSP